MTDGLLEAEEIAELLSVSVCQLLGGFDEERHAGVRDGGLPDDRPGSVDTVGAFQNDGLADVIGVAARRVFACRDYDLIPVFVGGDEAVFQDAPESTADAARANGLVRRRRSPSCCRCRSAGFARSPATTGADARMITRAEGEVALTAGGARPRPLSRTRRSVDASGALVRASSRPVFEPATL
jgi:hypothetical protein